MGKSLLDDIGMDIKLPNIKLPTLWNEKTGKKSRKPVSRGTLRELYSRSGGECEECGESFKGLKSHIHHKDRDSSNNEESNLIILCPNCHSRWHYKHKPKEPKKPKKPKSIFDIRV